MEGLHWVLNYYHHGCRSWNWYFPHLYSPLATDLFDLSEFYDEVDEEGFGSFPFEEVRENCSNEFEDGEEDQRDESGT